MFICKFKEKSGDGNYITSNLLEYILIKKIMKTLIIIIYHLYLLVWDI